MIHDMSGHLEIAGRSRGHREKLRNGDHQAWRELSAGRFALVVADGVGSAPCDHEASRRACTTCLDRLAAGTGLPLADAMQRALLDADAALRNEPGACAGMKSTIVLAVWDVAEESLFHAAIGDSRLYAWDGRELLQLSTDQRRSVVRRGPDGKPLRMAGAVVVAEGVTDALGAGLRQAVVRSREAKDLQAVLLCTDGYYEASSGIAGDLQRLDRQVDLGHALDELVHTLADHQQDDLTLLIARRRMATLAPDALLERLRGCDDLRDLADAPFAHAALALLPGIITAADHATLTTLLDLLRQRSIDIGRSALGEAISLMMKESERHHSGNYQRMVELMRRSGG